MFDDLIAAATIPDTSVATTTILTIGSVLVAITVLIGVIVQARKPNAPVAPPRSDSSLPPLSSWGGTQNEFLELVIQRHNQLDTKYTQLEERQEAEAREREKFTGAVRRYLETLAAGWPGPEKMPWPSEDDWDILEPTLPASFIRNRRRRAPIDPVVPK